MSAWVVILEWALGEGEPRGFDAESLRAVIEAVPDLDPIALCQPDRYAIQMRLEADCPVAAITEALARHREAVRRMPLGGELVRLELLTPEELDDEWGHFVGSPEGRSALDVLSGVPDPVAEAEAALDRITGPQDACRVLSRMVRQLGGGVVAARLEDEWTLPVDLALAHGQVRVPIAEPWSVARMRLEQALPRLVEKARAIVHDLEASAAGRGDQGPSGRPATSPVDRSQEECQP